MRTFHFTGEFIEEVYNVLVTIRDKDKKANRICMIFEDLLGKKPKKLEEKGLEE